MTSDSEIILVVIIIVVVALIISIRILKLIYKVFISPIVEDIRQVKNEITKKQIEERYQNMEIERHQKDIERRNKLIQRHKSTLIKKYKQLTYTDDYGHFRNDSFLKELDYFIKNVLFDKVIPSETDYQYEYNRLQLIIENAAEEEPNIEVENPYDFEKKCAEILNNNGWQAQTTPKSADQGIDVIAIKDGITVALQCKYYSKPVGNKAVQEAYSGKKFYNADYAGVVSNNTFTVSARQLAKNCHIFLLSPDDLKNLNNLLK